MDGRIVGEVEGLGVGCGRMGLLDWSERYVGCCLHRLSASFTVPENKLLLWYRTDMSSLEHTASYEGIKERSVTVCILFLGRILASP